MKLSASNIGWKKEEDERILRYMSDLGFNGLEIAPTRIFPERPYDNIAEISEYAKSLSTEYGIQICSMQSIWYGQGGMIFGSEEERNALILYTKKAIDFAEAAGCGNLVFGCPKNRVLPEGGDIETAVVFFRELGEYAAEHHTVLSMEANPPIYNTNFINTTSEAVIFAGKVASSGFKINLDVGTMLENGEDTAVIRDKISLVNHVHISEPFLKPVCEHSLHRDLADLLKMNAYKGFVSIEAGAQDNTDSLLRSMEYVKEIFG